MAITERKVFLQTLRNARSRVILLDRLKSSILNNTAVDLKTVPFSGSNSSNLYEAIQCYINYGELPLNGKIEDFWKPYEQTLQINNSEERTMKNTDWNKITQSPLTSFDFKSVESAFGMPMRYANNSSQLVACLEKSKLMLDDIFQEKINFLLNGLFYADGEVKKSLFIEENMSVFFELKKCVYDAHIKSLNKV